MKCKLIVFSFLISPIFLSQNASAQMSAIENLKTLSEQAGQQAYLYSQLLASQNMEGHFIFTRNEDIKDNLHRNGISAITECHDDKEFPSYCIDKREGDTMLKVYRSQLIEAQAYYQNYVRALRAVDSIESRRELRQEIEKQKRAKAELEQLLAERETQFRKGYAKEHPVKNFIHWLTPAFGTGVGLGGPYAFLTIILGPEALASALVGVVIVSSGGLAYALDIGEDIKAYVHQRAVQVKAQIKQKDQELSEQIKLSRIIDQAILENNVNIPAKP